MRWPKYWSFSFSIIPSKEIPGLISFRMYWLDLLAVQGTLKSLLQHHSSKASILWHSAFFTVQLDSLSHTVDSPSSLGDAKSLRVGYLFLFCPLMCPRHFEWCLPFSRVSKIFARWKKKLKRMYNWQKCLKNKQVRERQSAVPESSGFTLLLDLMGYQLTLGPAWR